MFARLFMYYGPFFLLKLVPRIDHPHIRYYFPLKRNSHLFINELRRKINKRLLSTKDTIKYLDSEFVEHHSRRTGDTQKLKNYPLLLSLLK